MEFIDILILPAILAIGVVVSWEDLHLKKIRNKWIFWGLMYGLGVLLILLLNFLVFNLFGFNLLFFDSAIFPLSYFGKVLVNSLLSFLVVFFLWKFELLPAGDAKLLFLFSFLLPLKYYWKSYLPLYPSFALIINIFVPIFFYFFVRGVMKLLKIIYDYLFKKERRQEIRRDAKKALWRLALRSATRISLRLIRIMAILILAGGILDYFGFFYDSYAYFFPVLIVLFRVINIALLQGGTFRARMVYHLLLVIFICVIFIIHTTKFGWERSAEQFWFITQISFHFSVLFTILVGVARMYVQKTGSKNINIDDLKPGMVLGEDKYILPRIGSVGLKGLTKDQKRIVKKWAKKNNIDSDYACEKIGSVNMGELTADQIDLIKRWARSHKAINELRIYQKFPFAAFIFAGTLLTLIIKQSIIIWAVNLL